MKTKQLFLKLFVLLVLMTGNKLFSQAAFSIDNTFDAGSGFFADGSIDASAVQSDDKIIIGGSFDLYNGTLKRYLVRVNADGTLDTAFTPSSVINSPMSQGYIKVLSNGKIFVASISFMTNQGYLILLNSDGTQDTSFATCSYSYNSRITSLDVLPDGRIIVGGNFSSFNGVQQKGVVLLQANGTLDTSFNITSFLPTTATAFPYTVLAQPDGKLLIGGNYKTAQGDVSKIVRFENNGTVDPLYTERFAAIGAMARRADGKVLIVGALVNNNNGVNTQGVLLLNTDGTVDAAYNTGNTGAPGYVSGVALLSGDKAVISGQFTTYNDVARNNLARLNADGTLDASFNPGTGFGNPNQNVVSVQSDGKLIVSGMFGTYNAATTKGFIRINIDGTQDTTFNAGNVGAQINGQVRYVVKKSDGKYLVGGNFTQVNGSTARYMVKLNADGSIDGGFNSGLTSTPTGFEELNNGKIMVSGFFQQNGNPTYIGILNADGTLDVAVPSPSPYSMSYISRITKDSTGKILVAGSLNSGSGNISGMYRLNEDGTLDTTFNQGGAGFNNGVMVTNLFVQSDGKILVAGDMITSYNGTSLSTKMLRLNTDGTLDTSFNSGTGPAGMVDRISVLPSGKIVILGFFTSYNGTNRPGIALINGDGSLDTGFNPATGASPQGRPVFGVVGLSDNSILITGPFSSFNGTTVSGGFARIALDGTVDANFNAGNTGPVGFVQSLLKQDDGKLMAAGVFSSFNGVAKNNMVRLEVTGLTLSTREKDLNKLSLYPNPAKDFVTVNNLTKGTEVSLYDMTGKQLYRTKATGNTVTIITSSYQNGMYVVKVNGQASKLLIAH